MAKCTTCNNAHTTGYRLCPTCRERARLRGIEYRRKVADGKIKPQPKRPYLSTLYATPDDLAAMEEPPMSNQAPKLLDAPDPWLMVCDICALPDCIRPEGGYQIGTRQSDLTAQKNGYTQIKCALVAAKLNNWSPKEALQNWHRLNIYKPE